MTIRAALRYAFVMLVAATPASSMAGDEYENIAAGLRVYTAMNYIEDEGEYVGLQIVVVPYGYGGEGSFKILWREAEARLLEPMLLDPKIEHGAIVVSVPEPAEDSGVWTLTPRKGGIDAAGPRDLHFFLRRTKI